ncbi:MAG: TolC family protein [Bacteroidales bacterium]|jgi:outer membrane protein TolC
MWKKKRNNLLTVLLLMVVIAPAQQSYTMSPLIDRVLSENYQVKMVKIDEQMAANNNTLGNAGMSPTISLQGSQEVGFYNTTQNLSSGDVREANNAKNTSQNALLSLDWMVFDGFRMFAMKNQLELLEKIGVVNTRYYVEQTVSDVAMLYEQLIASRQLLKNELSGLKVSAFRLRIERRKLDVGSGDALQYNQALVDFNGDSLSVLTRMSLIKSLEIQTNLLINNEPGLPLITVDTVIGSNGLPALDTLIRMAESANSQIEQSALQEMVAETNLKIQQAAFYPTLDLTGQYSYSYTTSKIGYATSNKNYGPLLGVTVRFNLFDGGNVRRSVKNADLTLTNAEIAKDNTSAMIRSSITNQYFQWQSLLQQWELATENRKAAMKSMEIAELQYEKGLIDGYNFRLTQVSVLRAANQVIQMELAIRLLEIALHRQAGDVMKLYQ